MNEEQVGIAAATAPEGVPVAVNEKELVRQATTDDVAQLMVDLNDAAGDIDDKELLALAAHYGATFQGEVGKALARGDGATLDKYRLVAAFLLASGAEQAKFMNAGATLAHSKVGQLPGVHDFVNVLHIANGYRSMAASAYNKIDAK